MARASVSSLLAALLLVPLGCGKKPQAEATPVEVTSKEVPSVSIRVLYPGKDGPRRALRFRPPIGSTSRIRLTTRDTWHENEKISAEAAVLILEGQVTEVTPDNDV